MLQSKIRSYTEVYKRVVVYKGPADDCRRYCHRTRPRLRVLPDPHGTSDTRKHGNHQGTEVSVWDDDAVVGVMMAESLVHPTGLVTDYEKQGDERARPHSRSRSVL